MSFSLYNHSAKRVRDNDEIIQVNLSFSSSRDPRFAQLSVMKHVCGVLETAEYLAYLVVEPKRITECGCNAKLDPVHCMFDRIRTYTESNGNACIARQYFLYLLCFEWALLYVETTEIKLIFF